VPRCTESSVFYLNVVAVDATKCMAVIQAWANNNHFKRPILNN